MNWTRGGKLSTEEIANLNDSDVVYAEIFIGNEDPIWKIADVGSLERLSVDLVYWDLYNVNVEDVAPDAEYRAGREKMRENGWTDELFEEYFPNQYDLRILPDIPLDRTPDDEKANRDWGMFS